MLPNVDKIESLLKEVNYNKENNTLDVGGNLYVDGYIQPSFEHTYQSGQYIAVYEINNTKNTGVMVLVEFVDDNGSMNYFGFGTREGSDYYLMAYNYDNDGIGQLVLSDQTSEVEVDFTPLLIANPTYFEHQLTVSTSTESFYTSYYSTNNLPIDSLQDLTAVVKPNANTKLGLGSTYLKYEDNVWKLASGDLVTTVADNVVVVD